MLFEFSGLGFLWADNYRGGFGYKKFLNDKTAVRGAFSLSQTQRDICGNRNSYPTDRLEKMAMIKNLVLG